MAFICENCGGPKKHPKSRICVPCVGVLKRQQRATRFWSKVNRNGLIHPRLQTRCWVWEAGRTTFGYGAILNTAAHRYAWELSKGKIPPELFVLHHCDNPPCVNPEHLYLGTQRENVDDRDSRGRNHESNVTHCPQGHEYSEENTYWASGKPGRLRRCCKICRAAHQRRVYLKRSGHRQHRTRIREYLANLASLEALKFPVADPAILTGGVVE